METPRPPDEPDFRVALRTRWSDEDNQAVLNNAVHLTLMEEARFAFFAARGLLDANRFPFLLAQANVRFVAPGRGGAEVVVELSTVEVGTTSFVQAYRIRAAADGAVWCEAEARLVCYDPASGAKRPIPAALRAALGG